MFLWKKETSLSSVIQSMLEFGLDFLQFICLLLGPEKQKTRNKSNSNWDDPLVLSIYPGEPDVITLGLQPAPMRLVPQTAAIGPGSLGPRAGGKPGAIGWPLRTNYAVRRKNLNQFFLLLNIATKMNVYEYL